MPDITSPGKIRITLSKKLACRRVLHVRICCNFVRGLARGLNASDFDPGQTRRLPPAWLERARSDHLLAKPCRGGSGRCIGAKLGLCGGRLRQILNIRSEHSRHPPQAPTLQTEINMRECTPAHSAPCNNSPPSSIPVSARACRP